MHVFKRQRLFVEYRRKTCSSVLPGGDVGEIRIIAERLSFGRLIFLTEVTPARFVTVECIDAHQLGEFEEVSYSSGLLERLVEFFVGPEHTHVLPELFAKCRDQSKCFL